MSDGRLVGKTAVVTGGAAGIGEAIARRFAAERAEVIVVDKAPAGAEVADELGGKFFQADLTEIAEVDDLAQFVSALGRRLDVVVANAGAVVAGEIETLPPDEWRRGIAVNLDSVWLTARAFLPRLAAGGGGSFVATSSQLAHVGLPGMSAYVAAKAGVLGFVRCAAAEYGSRGVRVNALCPGATRTLGTQRWLEGLGDPVAGEAMMADRTLLGRLGEPHEIAAAALFLASDEAEYVTGTSITVDGGYTTT
jgi:NAD(P)-dependent dehydrogenase (short-subunit alcohol dehydrogenase family)